MARACFGEARDTTRDEVGGRSDLLLLRGSCLGHGERVSSGGCLCLRGKVRGAREAAREREMDLAGSREARAEEQVCTATIAVEIEVGWLAICGRMKVVRGGKTEKRDANDAATSTLELDPAEPVLAKCGEPGRARDPFDQFPARPAGLFTRGRVLVLRLEITAWFCSAGPTPLVGRSAPSSAPPVSDDILRPIRSSSSHFLVFFSQPQH